MDLYAGADPDVALDAAFVELAEKFGGRWRSSDHDPCEDGHHVVVHFTFPKGVGRG